MSEDKKPVKKKSVPKTKAYTLAELNDIAKEGRKALREKEKTGSK